jgi:hypothetical protein
LSNVRGWDQVTVGAIMRSWRPVHQSYPCWFTKFSLVMCGSLAELVFGSQFHIPKEDWLRRWVPVQRPVSGFGWPKSRLSVGRIRTSKGVVFRFKDNDSWPMGIPFYTCFGCARLFPEGQRSIPHEGSVVLPQET